MSRNKLFEQISEIVELKWGTSNKRYYTNLGYKFTKLGNSFFVRSTDLSPSSNYKFIAICVICNNKRTVSFNRYSDVCKKCAFEITRQEIIDNQEKYNEVIKKISSSHKSRAKKEKHVLKSESTRFWRNQVYQRDNHTCQVCRKVGGRLNAHHLDAWHWCVDKRLDINNGITLCFKCHKDFHNKYGTRNNTRQQFEEYLCHLMK